MKYYFKHECDGKAKKALSLSWNIPAKRGDQIVRLLSRGMKKYFKHIEEGDVCHLSMTQILLEQVDPQSPEELGYTCFLIGEKVGEMLVEQNAMEKARELGQILSEELQEAQLGDFREPLQRAD